MHPPYIPVVIIVIVIVVFIIIIVNIIIPGGEQPLCGLACTLGGASCPPALPYGGYNQHGDPTA